jgi:hypothetical protein
MRRHDTDRLTLRGAEREYGHAREYLAERIRAGELRAVRHGRALLVDRAELVAWSRARAEAAQATDDPRVRAFAAAVAAAVARVVVDELREAAHSQGRAG